jgi:antitoxin HigA-1
MSTERVPPVHPGDILLEEFMKPMGISQNAPARALKVPPRRINEIIHGKRGISVLPPNSGLDFKTTTTWM